MANIGKHDSEKERKSNDSEEARVYFLVPRNSVSVDNFLKSKGNGIYFEVSWRLNGLVRP